MCVRERERESESERESERVRKILLPNVPLTCVAKSSKMVLSQIIRGVIREWSQERYVAACT